LLDAAPLAPLSLVDHVDSDNPCLVRYRRRRSADALGNRRLHKSNPTRSLALPHASQCRCGAGRVADLREQQWPAPQPSDQIAKCPSSQRDQSVAGSLLDNAEDPRSSIVSITILSIKPVKLGRIFALASVEIDIDGLVLVLHGVCALRLQPIGMLMFRDQNGVWRHALTLPDEISGPIGKSRARRTRRARFGRQKSRIMSRGSHAQTPSPLLWRAEDRQTV
jgi:hypothetical protein